MQIRLPSKSRICRHMDKDKYNDLHPHQTQSPQFQPKVLFFKGKKETVKKKLLTYDTFQLMLTSS